MKKFAKFIFNKTFLIVALIFIVIQICITLYTPVKNTITYKLYSYQLEKEITDTAENILALKQEKLEIDKNKALLAIEKEFENKQIELKSNFNEILDSSIRLNKANLKAQIELGIPINKTTIAQIETHYKKNFNKSLLEKNEDLLVYNDYSKVYTLPEIQEMQQEGVFEDIEITMYEEQLQKEIKDAIVNNTPLSDDSKPVKFDIKVKTQLDSGLQILDQSRYSPVLPHSITFPSFFSYSGNGIPMNSRYYDIHYGVDYRTKPKIYIDLPFFLDKEATIYFKANDGAGKRLYLRTNNERFEYLHLNKMYKNVGDTVKAGEVFGQTGTTGLSTGPHLHFSYIKDGFYVPFDWGLDVDNKVALTKFGLSNEEADKLVSLGKNDYISMESVLGIYWELKDRKVSDLEKIKEIIRKKELIGEFSMSQYLSDSFYKGRLSSDNLGIVAANARKHIDTFHIIKKESFKKFLKRNNTKATDIVQFKLSQLGSSYVSGNKVIVEVDAGGNDKVKETEVEIKVSDEIDTGSLNLGNACNNYTSKVFKDYKGKIIKFNNLSFLENHARKNIEKIAPMMYQVAVENDIVGEIKKVTGVDTEIQPCDIVLIELGKWYQEHTFNLDQPKNNAGLFQVLSSNYANQFPQDIGKEILSDEQYRKQIKDSMFFSANKLTYKRQAVWKGMDNADDYILKYWLGAFHGIKGGITDVNINKDFYVANNLFEQNLLLKDITATRKTAYKDGAFTVAAKIYLHFINK